MKRLFLVLTLCLLAYAPASYAQAPATPVPVPVAAPDQPLIDANDVAAPAAVEEPVKVTVDGDKVTVGDMLLSAGDVAKAVKNYKAQGGEDAGAKAAKRLGLMLLLAAIFKFLLSGLKLSTPFWKGTRGKALLKVITITLGLAAGFAAQLGMGEHWWDAITVGLSGPLAVAFHEYTYLIPTLAKKRAVKAAAAEPDKKG